MTDATMASYDECLRAAFGGSGTREERVAAFRKAMMIRCEQASRDLGRVLDNTPLLQSLGGQTTAFFELADWAAQALDEAKAEAKAGASERIPGTPR